MDREKSETGKYTVICLLHNKSTERAVRRGLDNYFIEHSTKSERSDILNRIRENPCWSYLKASEATIMHDLVNRSEFSPNDS